MFHPSPLLWSAIPAQNTPDCMSPQCGQDALLHVLVTQLLVESLSAWCGSNVRFHWADVCSLSHRPMAGDAVLGQGGARGGAQAQQAVGALNKEAMDKHPSFQYIIAILFICAGRWQVMLFWGKAERVVAFKRQQAVEALKKEAMDKHLSFLLGQTQRYSSLLAQRLAPGAENAAHAPPQPKQALGLPAAADEGSAARAAVPAQPQPEHALSLPASGAGAAERVAGQGASAALDANGGEALGVSMEGDAGRAGHGDSQADAAARAGSGTAEVKVEGAINGSGGGGAPVESDGEAEADMEAEEDDDEATLEEEEVCSQSAVLKILALEQQICALKRTGVRT